MTAQELIDLLKTAPPDARVIYRMCSDYTDLDEREVRILPAGTHTEYFLHNGNWLEYDARYWPKDQPPPTFVSLVVLPGN